MYKKISFDTDEFSKAVIKQVKRTGSDLFKNFEGIAILSLAAMRLSAIIAKAPIIIPSAMSPAVAIPVTSGLIIGGLITSMKKRRGRRYESKRKWHF